MTESGQVSNLCCQPCKPRAYSGLKRKKNKACPPRRLSASPLYLLFLTAQGEVGWSCSMCVYVWGGKIQRSGWKNGHEGVRENTKSPVGRNCAVVLSMSINKVYLLHRSGSRTKKKSGPIYSDDGEGTSLNSTYRHTVRVWMLYIWDRFESQMSNCRHAWSS